MDNETAQELVKTLLEDRKRQQEQHEQTQKLLLQAITALNQNNAHNPGPANFLTSNPFGGTKLTTDALLKNEEGSMEVDSFQTASLLTGDDLMSDVDDSESWHVQEPLQEEAYDEAGLKQHILEYPWTTSDIACLEDVVNATEQQEYFRKLSTIGTMFPTELEDSPDRSHLTHYEIFNVGADGAPMQILNSTGSKPVSRSLSIWNRIKAINTNAEKQKAVGRITIVREPSPLLFAALHYTHHKHMDVSELHGFLHSDDPALIRTPNPFSDQDQHQRSFSITFEYFTIIDEGCEPMSWQRADLRTGEVERSHIPISRCSSVVSLSLEGKAMGHVKNKKRRAIKRTGKVFDPFAPWRVLNIQCYPDTRASLDAHDSTKHYVNGPEAFLVTLCAEYKDAVKRLHAVYRAVTDLVQPPADFIFNLTTRDKLLFEDGDFTYSRRYFWAFNTLGVMNEDIEDMQSAYYEAFKDRVWDGTDKIIWPGSSEATASAKHTNWRRKMTRLRADIEEQMDRLRDVHKQNEDRMKYIKNLHNNLFNGTSVLESRRSVENAITTVMQGRNIRLLTLVTIFFLPLTFVTSVFGMTNMPQDKNFHPFAWSTLAICAPTYILIGSLNTKSGMEWWQRNVNRCVEFLRSIAYFVARCLALIGWRPEWTEGYQEKQKHKQALPETINLSTPQWERPKAKARPRHMSNDTIQHRPTFSGMPMLSNRTTAEYEKSEGLSERLERMNSYGQTATGEKEPPTPTGSFSFTPRRHGLSISNTGSPPPHRPSIGVVPISGQMLPPAFDHESELEKTRRRGTLMSIASESALEEKHSEDALSISSSASSGARRTLFSKMWPGGRKKRKDDIP